MSGHNKWSTIKHKKGAADAKRGKIFTKIIREITVAAKIGGGDPQGNPRLRMAIFNARTHNMPKDNVERAIKKGTGELEGVEYSDFVFEGYGPNGVALLVEGMTDNINRTSAEVRNIFGKGGGTFGAKGSVGWIFDRKGVILISREVVSEDQLMDFGLSNGADDIMDRGDHWEVQCAPENFENLRGALEKAKIPLASAELSMVPKNTVALNEEDAKKLIKLIETLEDNDDIQKVHGNFDISDEIMEKIS